MPFWTPNLTQEQQKTSDFREFLELAIYFLDSLGTIFLSSEIIRNKDSQMNQDALLRKSGRIRVDLEKLYRLRHVLPPYGGGFSTVVRRQRVIDVVDSIFASLEAVYENDLPPFVTLTTHHAIFRASRDEGTIEEIGEMHDSAMPAVFVCEEVPL